MEMKVQIPFQQLLTAVRGLTTAQKEKLIQELKKDKPAMDDKGAFIEMLLNGPVFTEKEIETIEANRQSIAKMANKKLMIEDLELLGL